MSPYWRVFPWDATAESGRRFSPSFVPRATGLGRFDLPVDLSAIRYLAESPAHAVAEALQPWRNQRLTRHHLELDGHGLALVQVTLPSAPTVELLDLGDPGMLAETPTQPDLVSSRHRDITQPIARQAWDSGHAGLRWWSSFWGDWHTTVLFASRVRTDIRFGGPTRLTMGTPALREAASRLGMTLAA